MGMWYIMSRRFEYITESLVFFSWLSMFVFQTVAVCDTIEVITAPVVEYHLTASKEEQTR
jgi:3-dehydroquinate dehydratase